MFTTALADTPNVVEFYNTNLDHYFLTCELQRDWRRKETVPGFMTLFFDMGGSAGVVAMDD